MKNDFQFHARVIVEQNTTAGENGGHGNKQFGKLNENKMVQEDSVIPKQK